MRVVYFFTPLFRTTDTRIVAGKNSGKNIYLVKSAMFAGRFQGWIQTDLTDLTRWLELPRVSPNNPGPFADDRQVMSVFCPSSLEALRNKLWLLGFEMCGSPFRPSCKGCS